MVPLRLLDRILCRWNGDLDVLGHNATQWSKHERWCPRLFEYLYKLARHRPIVYSVPGKCQKLRLPLRYRLYANCVLALYSEDGVEPERADRSVRSACFSSQSFVFSLKEVLAAEIWTRRSHTVTMPHLLDQLKSLSEPCRRTHDHGSLGKAQ